VISQELDELGRQSDLPLAGAGLGGSVVIVGLQTANAAAWSPPARSGATVFVMGSNPVQCDLENPGLEIDIRPMQAEYLELLLLAPDLAGPVRDAANVARTIRDHAPGPGQDDADQLMTRCRTAVRGAMEDMRKFSGTSLRVRRDVGPRDPQPRITA
jgi:hypothetical protein